ncbi:MAG: acylneuraminate cytidylyltransferase family protein [Alphaproteobacteria bacterium]|nr:acylneuraminate cytidylyltransferase family protein [Alphaproteobacteria bacterium]
MRTVAVIPARGGSKRLPRKNVQPLFGKPLIVWSIEACLAASEVDAVFVSSDDQEMLELAAQHGAQTIERPQALADDATPKIEAIRHAHKWLQDSKGLAPEIIISVQANSPEMSAHDLDKAVQLLTRLDCWEVFSIDENDAMNGAIRALRTHCLYNTFLSAHMAVVRANYVDVHTADDLALIERRYGDVESFVRAKQA